MNNNKDYANKARVKKRRAVHKLYKKLVRNGFE